MTIPTESPDDPNFSGIVIDEQPPPIMALIKKGFKQLIRTSRQTGNKQVFADAKRRYSLMSKTVYDQNKNREEVNEVKIFMRHAAVALAAVNYSNQRILRWSGSVLLVLVVPFFVRLIFSETLVPVSIFIDWAGAFMLVNIVILGIGATRRSSDRWYFCASASLAILTGFITYRLTPGQFSNPWEIAMHGNGWTYLFDMAMIMSLYTLLVVTPALVLAAQLTRARVVRRVPNFAVVNELAMAQDDLAARDTRIGGLDDRNKTILHLEYAASLINDGIPRKLAASGAIAQSVLKKKCALAAAAIRELQAEVAFADARRLENIRQSISKVVTVVCLGTYEIAPKGDLSEVPHLSFTRKMGRAAQTILLGIIPIAMILGFRYAGIRLSPQFNNWAIAIAILWAVIPVISALDPHYKSRLRAVQNVISAFRGGAN